MKFREMMLALGFKNWAKDAKPEEIAGALDELSTKSAAKDEASDAADKAAKDAKDAADKAAKDAADAAAKDEIKHASDCPCSACKDKAKDEDKVEKLDEDKKKDGEKDDAEVLPSDEQGQSTWRIGDAVGTLNELRPLVAKSKDPKVIDAFNKLARNVKQLKAGVKDGAPDPFVALTKISNNAAADAEPEIPMFQFFNGKSYADGLKAWNEYQQARSQRK